MTLVRSAIAACNTVDLRDTDNDITAMTVDLGLTVERYQGNVLTGTPPDPEPTTSRGELYARIYGTEKQLVISSVMIDRDAAGVYSVAVELFNPSDQPLQLDGYHLAVMNRGDTPAAPSGVTTDDGNVYVDNNAGAMVDGQADTATRLVLAVPGGTTLAPGGFIVIDSGGGLPGDITAVIPRPADPPVDPYDRTTPDPAPTAPPTQLIVGNPMPHLLQLAAGRDTGGRLNRELVLLRTRRADGVPYLDHDYTAGGAVAMEVSTNNRRPTMNEDLTTVQGLASLVPVDGVDCRSLDGRRSANAADCSRCVANPPECRAACRGDALLVFADDNAAEPIHGERGCMEVFLRRPFLRTAAVPHFAEAGCSADDDGRHVAADRTEFTAAHGVGVEALRWCGRCLSYGCAGRVSIGRRGRHHHAGHGQAFSGADNPDSKRQALYRVQDDAGGACCSGNATALHPSGGRRGSSTVPVPLWLAVRAKW